MESEALTEGATPIITTTLRPTAVSITTLIKWTLNITILSITSLRIMIMTHSKMILSLNILNIVANKYKISTKYNIFLMHV